MTSCLVCSKTFRVSKQTRHQRISLSPSRMKGVFCSRKCSAKWKYCIRERQCRCSACNCQVGWFQQTNNPFYCATCKEKRADARENQYYVTEPCGWCSADVQSLRAAPKLYCDDSCYVAWSRAKAWMTRAKVCQQCNKRFLPTRASKGMFCSKRCRGDATIAANPNPRKRYQPLAELQRMNRRAAAWERAYHNERKVCGSDGCVVMRAKGKRYCNPCRTERRLHHKQKQNKRYGDFYRSGVREKVMERDGRVCQYCRRKPSDNEIVVDHIRPVAKGGTNSMRNLVTSCFMCNAMKEAKTPLELFFNDNWLGYLGTLER